jgi:uncharacterized protein (DUF433 family)
VVSEDKAMTTVPLEYIEVDDRGVAKLIGTRTKVRMVVIDSNAGRSPAWIHKQYPHLSLSQIHAALAYYYEHKDEIDREIEESARFADEMRAKNPNRYTRAELEARWKQLYPDRPLPSPEPEPDDE